MVYARNHNLKRYLLGFTCTTYKILTKLKRLIRDEKQGLKTARQSQCYILGLLVAFGMINEKNSGLRGAKGHWGPPRIRMQCRHIFTQNELLVQSICIPFRNKKG